MKYFFLLTFIYTIAFSNILNINSFEADFKQEIKDEKGKVLLYSGHVISIKPKSALWSYTSPVKKSIYIVDNTVTIVEPEIEQVIVKHISSEYDFFNLIKNAKEIQKNKYLTIFKEQKYIITLRDFKLFSISYTDEFDNDTLITFSKQEQNKNINKNLFLPSFPQEFDLIQE